MKQNIDIFVVVLYSAFNHCSINAIFPSILKAADVTPVFEKEKSTNKNNYGPISIFSNILQVLGRCKYQQISTYFEDNILSKC